MAFTLAILTEQEKDSLCKLVVRETGMDDFVIITFEIFILVVLSHLLHSVFKCFGQPSIVSHMLAGLLVGRTFLNRIHTLRRIYKLDDDDYLMGMTTLGSTFFMFLVGLEMDFQFLRRSIRRASLVTLGITLTSTLIASIAGPILYGTIRINGGRLLFVFTLIIIFSNSASPVLIRMMAELKMTISVVGRIGISAALISDVICLVIIAVVVFCPMPKVHQTTKSKLVDGVSALVLIIGSAWILKITVYWINRMSKKRRVIQDELFWVLLLLVIWVTMLSEYLGYPSMMAAFIMGLVFPRYGPTTRTMVGNLTFCVNELILPIYFGYAGVQTDLLMLRDREVLITVATIFILGTVGKVASTLVVAKYLRMQVKEGLVLGLLLNVKGHVELIIITLGKKYGIWDKQIYQALLISTLFSSMTVSPAAAYIVRRERRAMKYRSTGLERLNLEAELRILACVHSPHDIPTILDLFQISSGIDCTPLAPYLMHLIEFTGSITTSMLYYQVQEEDDMDIGGQYAGQVNAAVDAFNQETGINLRQLTAVSSYTSMHEDMCNGAQDICAAMTIVPYHRKQRFDGKMGARNDGVREFNKNVLQHAPCTVGILVDRGLGGTSSGAIGGTASSTHLGAVPANQALHQVMVLFLGGPDDREAVAYGTRLAMHPCVSVTIVRFLPALRMGSRGFGNNECNSIYKSCEMFTEGEGVGDSDEEFMADVHGRFISTGMISYVEKVLDGSAEMVNTLASMEGMYSLFIVGRHRQGATAQLTLGLSEWQECPELGVIGDLLASSDFISTGSVLVVQQQNASVENHESLMVMSMEERLV